MIYKKLHGKVWAAQFKRGKKSVGGGQERGDKMDMVGLGRRVVGSWNVYILSRANLRQHILKPALG